ncbi:AI-2E family transporter [Haloarcula montana]|uniref:AI-2E family transporter n=1 Tax=Haloarcula montana TaxID=3111776 RepID=UPI002D782FC4|nr:AI-2E family transporter [Haloarcula sp. GH36]
MRSRQRTYVLGGLFVATVLLATWLLSSVLATVFFAITVAYVLYPLSEWLVDRGLSKRVAAMLSTVVAFLAGTAIALPLVGVLYVRRRELFVFLQQLPPTLTLRIGEFAYPINVADILLALRGIVQGFAVTLATLMPILALKAVLFAILVYAILWRPAAPKHEIYELIPRRYHDILDRLHRRLRSTLYAIYVLQAATAFGTFLMAWAVFAALGYQSAFALAVVAGILQFVPVVGPSVVVLAIAVADVVAGDVVGAVLVTVVGLVLVGFLPDAVIRPRLARYTAGMPASLYFVGFTGGVLSLGLVGFIAGPVVVALLIEMIHLLTEDRSPTQQQLS